MRDNVIGPVAVFPSALLPFSFVFVRLSKLFSKLSVRCKMATALLPMYLVSTYCTVCPTNQSINQSDGSRQDRSCPVCGLHWRLSPHFLYNPLLLLVSLLFLLLLLLSLLPHVNFVTRSRLDPSLVLSSRVKSSQHGREGSRSRRGYRHRCCPLH